MAISPPALAAQLGSPLAPPVCSTCPLAPGASAVQPLLVRKIIEPRAELRIASRMALRVTPVGIAELPDMLAMIRLFGVELPVIGGLAQDGLAAAPAVVRICPLV